MKLRVWRVVNNPNNFTHYPVKSEEEAIKKINELAQIDLKSPFIDWNAFGLEVFNEEKQKWDGEEYYNEEGEDIREIEERLEEEKAEGGEE